VNHIICHTHWDREWFAPSNITNKWLLKLFQNLSQRTKLNEEYKYVLDGQTLILEDLLSENPDLEDTVRKLISKGSLIIGPFYAQIDFRLSSESAILKNLEIGKKDMEKFNSFNKVAWAVDNFGFISQLPQVLNMYGIQDIFLWRGVNLVEPVLEFIWTSPDGSRTRCIFLVGGYRNLYGLSFTPDLAQDRVEHEAEKLTPFSRSGIIPLLDGYDLETNPEDPTELVKGITISFPKEVIDQAFSKLSEVPIVKGEMIAGKYACVFPGTLSTRSHLKVQSYVVDKVLRYKTLFENINSKRCEKDDELYRDYLKTLVHDNICGVGIDQIHDNMSKKYKKLYWKSRKILTIQLGEILSRTNLKKGVYALTFSPYKYDVWYANDKICYKLQSNGVGLYKINEFDKRNKDDKLTFQNEYYSAHFQDDGSLKVNDIVAGIIILQKEFGDAYSSHTTDTDFSVSLKSICVERSGDNHKIVRLEREIIAKNVFIKTEEKVIFDGSPLIRWEISAELRGKNYKLVFACQTYDRGSKVFAKMPFEIVQRERSEEIQIGDSEKLKRVLLAAREEGTMKVYPFQGFVALSDTRTRAIMAKGLHEYEVNSEGLIGITLVRSVEWIAKRKVQGRTGDAGPLVLVPGARCNGRIKFELAFVDLDQPVHSPEFFKWFSLFEDQPARVSLFSNLGESDCVDFYKSDLPWVCATSGKIVFYNPFPEKFSALEPYKIGLCEISPLERRENDYLKTPNFRLNDFISFPEFIRFKSEAEKKRDLHRLTKMINKRKRKIRKLEEDLKKAINGSRRYYTIMHKMISEKRTLLELQVSKNLVKGRVSEYLMSQLNDLRSKKRILDYIIEIKGQRKTKGGVSK
jgi:hypothetical protein